MRPKILNSEQENWLVLHFDAMPTDQLASILTEMVKDAFVKERDEIRRLLPSMPNNATKIKALNRIRFIDSFKHVSVAMVKRIAKHYGCKKKKSYLSSVNRKKARNYHLKRMTDVAIEVKNPMKWFRTFEYNKVYIAKYNTARELKVLQNSISNWNNGEGKIKEIYLNPEHYAEAKIIKINTHIYKI